MINLERPPDHSRCARGSHVIGAITEFCGLCVIKAKAAATAIYVMYRLATLLATADIPCRRHGRHYLMYPRYI